MTRIYPVRYDEAQYDGLQEAAKRFGLTGRQKAQREINRLYMAFFGIIKDTLAAATMESMIKMRKRELKTAEKGAAS